jgi:hypothetical protein
MKKLVFTLAFSVVSVLSMFGTTSLIIPKLYLPTRNTPSGDSNWTIQNAPINNTNTDYWKMLSNSVIESPMINFAGYSDVVINLQLQSYGTIANHSDDIAVYISNGNDWVQLGTNLHTTSISSKQNIAFNHNEIVTKIRIVAPNSTLTVGARVLSVEITGTPVSAPMVALNEVALPVFSAEVGDSIVHKFIVSGANLSSRIRLSITGENSSHFHLSSDSISGLNANLMNEVTLKYKPTTTGEKKANLVIESEGASPINKTISANTQIATLNSTYYEPIQIKEEGGKMFCKATDGEKIEVIGLNGISILSFTAVEGWNEIITEYKGICVLKIGKRILKIML